MTIEVLLVAALSCWRITSLLIREDGPFDIFMHIRTLTGRIRGLEALTTCVWCLSFWIGAAVSAVAFTTYWWLLMPFALSAAAVGLDKVLHDRI